MENAVYQAVAAAEADVAGDIAAHIDLMRLDQ